MFSKVLEYTQAQARAFGQRRPMAPRSGPALVSLTSAGSNCGNRGWKQTLGWIPELEPSVSVVGDLRGDNRGGRMRKVAAAGSWLSLQVAMLTCTGGFRVGGIRAL